MTSLYPVSQKAVCFIGDRKGWYAGLVAGLLILALMVYSLTPASYGLRGIILAGSLALFFKGTGWFCLPAAVAAGAALFFLNGASHLYSQPVATLVFAVLPTMSLPLMVIQLADYLKSACSGRFMPRHFFYVTYACHLLLLWLVKFMLA
ncbi:TPA: TraX family protein [Serratia fonticola]|uniref:TraX family protein n=1 Tax=Serratia fonticola TaxID=47917 RepID=UPI0028DB68A5|nr:TraX family protein [Serratia fonticola]